MSNQINNIINTTKSGMAIGGLANQFTSAKKAAKINRRLNSSKPPRRNNWWWVVIGLIALSFVNNVIIMGNRNSIEFWFFVIGVFIFYVTTPSVKAKRVAKFVASNGSVFTLTQNYNAALHEKAGQPVTEDTQSQANVSPIVTHSNSYPEYRSNPAGSPVPPTFSIPDGK